jgi:hypothetical protein
LVGMVEDEFCAKNKEMGNAEGAENEEDGD